MKNVMRTISAAVKAGRFCWRHKRMTLALAVGLLILAPLLTGSGAGVFFLNLIGLGIAALVVRRIFRGNNRKQSNCRCNCQRQRSNTQQQGGTP